jgi:hypothetical protein
MSQPPDAGPAGDEPDDDRSPQPSLPPWSGIPYYPGFATGYGDPRFDPADPLVSGDYAGWWRRGFAVLRRGWRALALVQVFTAVPALALLIPGQLFADLAARDLAQAAAGDGRLGLDRFLAAGGVSTVALLVASLIFSVGTLANARLVVTVATGGEPRAGRALRSVLPRVPALIGWSMLAGLLSLVALLACLLPVIYVGAVLVMLPAVVLFEPGGGGISRCFSLFHTELGAAVARIATIAGLGIGISLIFSTLSAVLTAMARGTAFPGPLAAGTAAVVADSVAGTVLSVLGTLIGGVVLTPLIVATYADLRARREPFVTAYLAT